MSSASHVHTPPVTQPQKNIKCQQVETTSHRLSLNVGDQMQRLVVNWVALLYINYHCQAYLKGQ